jgi:capsular polysaccharide export protein
MTYGVEALPSEVEALGFSLRKRKHVRRFLPECSVRFLPNRQTPSNGAAILLWGSREAGPLGDSSRRILRMEDGFLRSVGLGADLTAPMSWVIDSCGIYYDASQPSDLERLLQQHRFDDALMTRAAALRESLVTSGITKYNVGRNVWVRPATARRVVLVPGQVEQDASIKYGSPVIHRNCDLLAAVRAACPEAYIVYKPHPDVVSGLRRAGKGETSASRWYDEIVEDVDMGFLLDEVDEVHTLTSLTGFEALLRGRRVVTYGQPFYAGWGLTEDRVPVQRRTRRLSVDALVAGALLLYPRYLSRRTGELITAEAALEELLAWRAESGDWARRLKNPTRAPVRRVLRWAERR